MSIQYALARSALARGKRDGFNHCMKVMGGEQGKYRDDDYPSNPYNKEGHSKLWAAYNRGFKLGYQAAFSFPA